MKHFLITACALASMGFTDGYCATPVATLLFAQYVTQIVGEAGDVCPARQGDTLQSGERLLTPAGAISQLVLADGSLIGMGAVILDRAHIGKKALVAAGAVVREGFVVPDGMLVGGVPARVLRALTEEEKKSLLESASHYVKYAESFRASTMRK